DVAFDAAAVDAPHEQAILILRRYGAALEHQSPRVSPATLLMVLVVADLRQQAVGVGIHTTARLADVGSPRNHVEAMRNDASREEGLPMRIEIESPGIAGPFGEDLELSVLRCVTPHRGVEADVADLRLGKNAV